MRALLPILVFLVAAVANAASPADDISRFAERVVREFPDVPGLGVAVVRAGKPVLVRGFGLADVATRRPVTADTSFYTGSLAKSYTGLLCAVLAERKMLDLDAPIAKYLPEATLPAPIDASKVTLRRLLTHTAGIANDPITFRTAYTGDAPSAEVVRLLPLTKARANDAFRYDNLGYIIAAAVVERVTGKPWQRAMDEYVLRPLALRETTTKISSARNLATTYDLDHEGRTSPALLLKTDDTMHPAGGVVSTPRDLARWLIANMERTTLPRAAYEEAQKAQVPCDEPWYRFHRTGYGFGWYSGDFEGDRIVQHFGDYVGWRAHVSFLPEKRVGVAVTINSSGLGAALVDVVAAYALDRMRNVPDLAGRYERELAAVRKRMDERRAAWVAEIARRSTRKPTLLHPAASYAGSYVNDIYGTITVAETAGGLTASIGRLRSPLEPFTEAEVARVELVPGSGEPMRFVWTSADAPLVRWRGVEFRRR